MGDGKTGVRPPPWMTEAVVIKPPPPPIGVPMMKVGIWLMVVTMGSRVAVVVRVTIKVEVTWRTDVAVTTAVEVI